MLRAARQLLFCGGCGLARQHPRLHPHHQHPLSGRHLSSAGGRQWLKHVLPEAVYPAFRHERREVPVYIRIPDVPRQEMPDDGLFVESADGGCRLVRSDGIDWLAYYDRVHRELQAGATLHDQLLDAAVTTAEVGDPSSSNAATFERLVRPLLQHRCRLLELIWAGQLAVTLDQSDLVGSHARLIDSLLVKLRMHLQECYQDADYLASLERVRNLDKSLTDQQIWVVNKEIRECRRACFYDATASQPPKQMSHVATQMRQLAELEARFETNVITTGTFYRMVISDPALFEPYTRPEFLEHLRSMNSEGLHVLTLAPGLYEEFMQVCRDRASRQAAWSAHSGLAGRKRHFATRLDNPTVITDQRTAFDTLSEALGYENKVAMDLRQCSQDGLPQSVQSVIDLLEVLKRRYQPIALDHFNRVSDFAQDNGGMTDGPLQAWDWDYWQRKLLAEHSYPAVLSMAQLRQNWFDLIRQLFSLSFEPNDQATVEAAQLHPHHTVEVFDLRRSGDGNDALLGRLVWLSGGRMRKVVYQFLGGTGCLAKLYAASSSSDQQHQLPVAYQAWDLPIVASTDSAAMAGRLAAVLQQLTGHPAMGPYLSPDRRETRSYFLPAVFHCLASCPDPAIQQLLLAGGGGGSSNPDWLAVSELLAGQRAMNLLGCLYRAAYTVELWTTDANWQRAQAALGRDFLPFFQHDLPDDEWPCSALDIFGVSGLRESALDRLFNTVLAMDSVGVLTGPASDGDMGARFRDSFLEPESGHSFVEAYRRFCGRDPAGG